MDPVRDYLFVDCMHCREVLSARLDGEESASEESLIEAHLTTCGGCRRFADDAAHVTRLARTAVATEVPDLVGPVLAAVPRQRAPRLVTVLRVLLGLVGIAQLAVALNWVLAVRTGGQEHDVALQLSGASLQHFAHESAAWNVSLGVGFLWVAWRSSRTSGMVPTLATFVVVLTGPILVDLGTGWVDPSRLLLHGLVLLGLVLVILLDRRRRPAGDTVPGGSSSGRRWSNPAPQQDPAMDTDADGLPVCARPPSTAAPR